MIPVLSTRSRMLKTSMSKPNKPLIPSRGTYAGAILKEGQTGMDDFNRVTGIRHALFMTFVSFPEVLDPGHRHHGKLTRFVQSCAANRAIPAVTLEAFGGLNSYSMRHVTEFADLLDSFKSPLILRWNHEMNGSWYPWGQQPDLYVSKFREFANVIHARAPGVAMAWTPNQGWGYPWSGCEYFNPRITSLDPYLPYYPGDEFVDWVGTSFYHWGETRGANQVPPPGKWGAALGVENPVPNFHDIFAAGRDKPMMIAETSALYDTGDSLGGGTSEAEIKKAWIQQVYNLADNHQPRLDVQFPMIKAIFWFNILKFEAEVKGDVDWRVDSNPEVCRFYSQALGNHHFTTTDSRVRQEVKDLEAGQ
jgi:hypothetical protein